MGSRPPDPKSNSRIYIEAEKIPQLVPPAIIQPYEKLGQSQSGIVCDMSDGKFGPFDHQMFCADQHHSNIGRFVLDKVKGRYQGVCFPFREGFASGIVPMIQAADGSFFVGGTNRGWGCRGPKEFSLERLVWTGKTPFEMYDMKLKPDGFDLTFTEPVDKATAGDAANYKMTTFRYVYRADYGSPEVDPTTCTIKSATGRRRRQGRASGGRRPAAGRGPHAPGPQRALRRRQAAAAPDRVLHALAVRGEVTHVTREIARLAGSRPLRGKHKDQNPKHETNRKQREESTKGNDRNGAGAIRARFGHLLWCFPLCLLDLFRASCFALCASGGTATRIAGVA